MSFDTEQKNSISPRGLVAMDSEDKARHVLGGLVVREKPLALKTFLALTNTMVPAIRRLIETFSAVRDVFPEVLTQCLKIFEWFTHEQARLRVARELIELTTLWLALGCPGHFRHGPGEDWESVRRGRGKVRWGFNGLSADEISLRLAAALATPGCKRLRSFDVQRISLVITRIINLIATEKWLPYTEAEHVVAVRTSLLCLRHSIDQLSAQLDRVEDERAGATVLARLVLQR